MTKAPSQPPSPAIKYYLIAYNTITSLLWSYLLVLVILHLFFPSTLTSSATKLNPLPNTQTYPTASSYLKGHLQHFFSLPSAAKRHPEVAKASGALGALVQRARTTYRAGGIGVATALIQSLAVLEVVHAVVGWTKSPVQTTIMQVASRLIVVWWIVENSEAVCYSTFAIP